MNGHAVVYYTTPGGIVYNKTIQTAWLEVAVCNLHNRTHPALHFDGYLGDRKQTHSCPNPLILMG